MGKRPACALYLQAREYLRLAETQAGVRAVVAAAKAKAKGRAKAKTKAAAQPQPKASVADVKEEVSKILETASLTDVTLGELRSQVERNLRLATGTLNKAAFARLADAAVNQA